MVSFRGFYPQEIRVKRQHRVFVLPCKVHCAPKFRFEYVLLFHDLYSHEQCDVRHDDNASMIGRQSSDLRERSVAVDTESDMAFSHNSTAKSG